MQNILKLVAVAAVVSGFAVLPTRADPVSGIGDAATANGPSAFGLSSVEGARAPALPGVFPATPERPSRKMVRARRT